MKAAHARRVIRFAARARAKADMIAAGVARAAWVDGRLWVRVYKEGGYDGYRSLGGERLPCGELARRVPR